LLLLGIGWVLGRALPQEWHVLGYAIITGFFYGRRRRRNKGVPSLPEKKIRAKRDQEEKR
jgi:hypothetical protein